MLSGKLLTLSVSCGNGQVRNMATLKEISNRLKAVSNIQKITKSMKMVSAAKYARAERELKCARPYGQGNGAFYNAMGEPAGGKEELIIAMTSDRGLCGAVHSSISRTVKRLYNEKDPEKSYKLILVGDKAKAQLGRLYPEDILYSFNNIGKKAPTFSDAALIANTLLEANLKFDTANIYYNYFKSVISYETTNIPMLLRDQIEKAEKLSLYDSVDENVLQMYSEFSLTNQIFYVLKEGACSEQSARMTAMENASRNAGDMIGSLTLKYNRTRQAVITRELIEIISGASVIEE